MKKVLWKPPRLRIGEGAEAERHATWLELFYDLLFAAVVAQLTFQLSQNLSGFGILSFVILCVPVWWAWAGQAFYATRFDTDDLGHRLFIIVQMFAVTAWVPPPSRFYLWGLGLLIDFASGLSRKKMTSSLSTQFRPPASTKV